VDEMRLTERICWWKGRQEKSCCLTGGWSTFRLILVILKKKKKLTHQLAVEKKINALD
jgi:hypothetical protein